MTTIFTPLPKGANNIGHVDVDSLPSIPTGYNVIGHVIVDSAGSVTVTSLPSIPAGSNVIGHVIVDSASNVSVTSLPSLPAGSNSIGNVGLNAGNNLIGQIVNRNSIVISDGTVTPIITTKLHTVGSMSNAAAISGTVSQYITLIGFSIRVIPAANLQFTDSSDVFNLFNMGPLKAVTPLNITYKDHGFYYTVGSGANLGYNFFPSNLPVFESDISLTYIKTSISNPLL